MAIHDYEFVYKPKKRRYVFEPVPNCETFAETIDAFSSRTGISKRDCRIFFQYLREFVGDAVESNAKIRLTGIFDLRYRITKERRMKNISGEWTTFKPIIRPYLYLPRRLKERGRMELSKEEYDLLFSKNDEDDEIE